MEDKQMDMIGRALDAYRIIRDMRAELERSGNENKSATEKLSRAETELLDAVCILHGEVNTK